MQCLQRINISDHADKLPEIPKQQSLLQTGHTCDHNNIYKHLKFWVIDTQKLN